MKLHYYESILNFYCDSLTEEELLEKIREWTLRYLWYRKKREEEGGTGTGDFVINSFISLALNVRVVIFVLQNL